MDCPTKRVRKLVGVLGSCITQHAGSNGMSMVLVFVLVSLYLCKLGRVIASR